MVDSKRARRAGLIALVLLALDLSACGSRTALEPGAAAHAKAVAGSGGGSGDNGGTNRGGTSGANRGGGHASNGGAVSTPATGGTPTGDGTAGETSSAGDSNAGAGGMPSEPLPISVTQLAVGSAHACALFSNGSVKCWGSGFRGELGYGNQNNVGDDELLSSIPAVSLTTAPDVVAVALAAGDRHTCAILSDGTVKCWGANYNGQLGYGHTRNIGDNELPSSVDPVSITTTPGLKPVALAAKLDHTCALLSDGSVKCWGANRDGQLGYGNTTNIGDDELPSSVGPVSITTTPGVTTVALSASYGHVCALLSDNTVRCWGEAGLGSLGYGNADDIGDDELPSSVGALSLTTTPGVKVVGITGGDFHNCAWFSDGSARCWGFNNRGQLGYGNTADIGDDELPSSVGPLAITSSPGVTVIGMAAAIYHTCALLSDGSVKCWGYNDQGAPGYPGAGTIGDNELPSTIAPVSVTTTPGLTVTRIAAGGDNTCVILSNGSAKCWGYNGLGELAHANKENIGDNEAPSSIGPIVF